MDALRRVNSSNDSRIDYGIILNVLLLAIIGIASVYATTVMIEGKNLIPTLYHALWYGVGTLTVIIIIQFDSKQYWKLSTILYGVGMFLLVLVLIFYDRETAAQTGAQSWFRLGAISFQPSEVFKPAYIVFLSRIITEHNNTHTNRTLKSDWILLGKIAMFALPPMLLIQLQNDLGTNLVLVAITVGLILLSGVSWKIIVPAISIVTVVGGALIYLAAFHPDLLTGTGLVKSYQIARIQAWFNPFGDTQNAAYQLAQSMKAIGSGQFSCKGCN